MANSKRKRKERYAELLIIYPWLKEFDKESKRGFRIPEMDITSSHVLKILTLLESKVSSEVSILKTKPNRATKFLQQIRKRIAVTKLFSWLTNTDTELHMLPTFGLLLMHYVNITLVSSKVQKLGVKEVASDLYYMLKLMLQLDFEYVLDVVLCSNLAEHASSSKEAGFHIFSSIVDDWRSCFKESSKSTQLKYCYVAALLSESPEGHRFIERNLPSETDKTFVEYLNSTLGMKLKVNKAHLLSNIVQQIKTKRVIIAMSRRRLVIVSDRTISKKGLSQDDRDSDSTSQSSRSAVVNIAKSGMRGRKHHAADSSQIDLMDNLGFCLDTAGNRDYGKDDSDGIVSSSTTKNKKRRASDSSTDTLTIPRNVKTKLSLSSSKLDEESDMDDDDDDEENDDDETNQPGRMVRRSHPTRKLSSSSDELFEIPPRTNSMDVEVGGLQSSAATNEEEMDIFATDQQREQIGKELKEELCAEIDSEPDHRHDENDDESDKEQGYEKVEDDDVVAKPRRSTRTELGLKLNSEAANVVVEEDSDVEFVLEAERPKTDTDDESSTTNERDEAEAESGEDVVPNYDEDSDEEIHDQNETKGTVTAKKKTASNNFNKKCSQDEVTYNDVSESEDDSDDEESQNSPKVSTENKSNGKLAAAAEELHSTSVVNAESGSQESNSTDVIPRTNGNGNTMGYNGPDISQQSTVDNRQTEQSSDEDDDDDDYQPSVSTSSSLSASPIKGLSSSERHDNQEDSQDGSLSLNQAMASPSAQSKSTRGRKTRGRGGVAKPASVISLVSTRRVTRACSAIIMENSQSETGSCPKALRSRPVGGRGRGCTRATTSGK